MFGIYARSFMIATRQDHAVEDALPFDEPCKQGRMHAAGSQVQKIFRSVPAKLRGAR